MPHHRADPLHLAVTAKEARRVLDGRSKHLVESTDGPFRVRGGDGRVGGIYHAHWWCGPGSTRNVVTALAFFAWTVVLAASVGFKLRGASTGADYMQHFTNWSWSLMLAYYAIDTLSWLEPGWQRRLARFNAVVLFWLMHGVAWTVFTLMLLVFDDNPHILEQVAEGYDGNMTLVWNGDRLFHVVPALVNLLYAMLQRPLLRRALDDVLLGPRDAAHDDEQRCAAERTQAMTDLLPPPQSPVRSQRKSAAERRATSPYSASTIATAVAYVVIASLSPLLLLGLFFVIVDVRVVYGLTPDWRAVLVTGGTIIATNLVPLALWTASRMRHAARRCDLVGSGRNAEYES